MAVDPAPCQEIVHRAEDADFDLFKLIPAPTNTPVDAGPYITLGMCYAHRSGGGKYMAVLQCKKTVHTVLSIGDRIPRPTRLYWVIEFCA